MNPELLHNPETAARGLDTAALEGKSISEIRTLIDGDDMALVLATEDVPAHLPREILRKELNVHEGKPSLSWMYQSDSGEWGYWYGHIVDPDWVRRDGDPPEEVILAEIYTTRPRATPEMRVRPIASLAFDRRGICRFASAARSQFNLLHVQAAKRLERVQGSSTPQALEPSTADQVLTALVAPFALVSPTMSMTLGDWDPQDARTGQFGWTAECSHRALLLMNLQMDLRASIIRGEDHNWSVVTREGEIMWPPIPIDENGLRVRFLSADGVSGPAFDVFSGDLGIEIEDEVGGRNRVRVLVAQRRTVVAQEAFFDGGNDASKGTDSARAAVLLLGDREANATAPRVTVKLRESTGMTEVLADGRVTGLELLKVDRAGDGNGSILVAARFWNSL